MTWQEILEDKIKRREALIEMDLTIIAAKNGAGVGLFDQDGQKHWAADADFWDWRDELLERIEREIEDIRRLQEMAAMEQEDEKKKEQQRKIDAKIDMLDRKDFYS